MNKPRLILIDLDGTLVDSVPDLAICVDAMMERIGGAQHGESKVRDWVGNGVERLVRRALVGKLEGEPDESAFKQAYPIFLDLYQEYNGKHSQLYSGVVTGLDYLRKSGYTLGCITNKAARFSEPLLKDMKIDDYFSIIISGDTLPKKKPDPLPLLHAAEHFNIPTAESLMLGDSSNDVKAARAAGFQVICVSYGYNHGRDIREAKPDAVVDSMAELSGIL